jgi:hypothetical protein
MKIAFSCLLGLEIRFMLVSWTCLSRKTLVWCAVGHVEQAVLAYAQENLEQLFSSACVAAWQT